MCDKPTDASFLNFFHLLPLKVRKQGVYFVYNKILHDKVTREAIDRGLEYNSIPCSETYYTIQLKQTKKINKNV